MFIVKGRQSQNYASDVHLTSEALNHFTPISRDQKIASPPFAASLSHSCKHGCFTPKYNRHCQKTPLKPLLNQTTAGM